MIGRETNCEIARYLFHCRPDVAHTEWRALLARHLAARPKEDAPPGAATATLYSRSGMKPRTNDQMALTIAEGLVVDSLLGSETAWAYLAANGVPAPTILRVLISQERRRSTDPIYAADSDGSIIWYWLPPQPPASADCSINTTFASITKALIASPNAVTQLSESPEHAVEETAKKPKNPQ